MLDSGSNDISGNCPCQDCRRGLVHKSHQDLHRRFHSLAFTKKPQLGSIENFAIFRNMANLARLRDELVLGSDGSSMCDDSNIGEDSNCSSIETPLHQELQPTIKLFRMQSQSTMVVQGQTVEIVKTTDKKPAAAVSKKPKKSKSKAKKKCQVQEVIIAPVIEEKAKSGNLEKDCCTRDADYLCLADEMAVIHDEVYKVLRSQLEEGTKIKVERVLTFDQY